MKTSQRAKLQTAIAYLVLGLFAGFTALYANGLGASADATAQLTSVVRPIVMFMTIVAILLLGVSVFLFMAVGRDKKAQE